ncbi:MAG: DUF1801 domain-containing protein [Piscinibacter sp.]|nr:DUF1801 domain-containing protein [Piscinibacter sp.]
MDLRLQRLAQGAPQRLSGEVALYPLLTFTGSAEHDPAIARWFASRPDELGVIAWRWFALMRQCGPDVRELLHDGYPLVCVRDAPFAYVNAFTSHVNVGFFHGASLPDPARRLVGTGRYMRHVKLRPGEPPDEPALRALIDAAYQDILTRLPSPSR